MQMYGRFGPQRKWKVLCKLVATAPLYIPSGGIPWGDAVGWQDVTGVRRRHRERG